MGETLSMDGCLPGLNLTHHRGTLVPMQSSPPAAAWKDAKEAFELSYFAALNTATHGNVSAMARASGLGRANVRRWLARCGIPLASAANDAAQPRRA